MAHDWEVRLIRLVGVKGYDPCCCDLVRIVGENVYDSLASDLIRLVGV